MPLGARRNSKCQSPESKNGEVDQPTKHDSIQPLLIVTDISYVNHVACNGYEDEVSFS